MKDDREMRPECNDIMAFIVNEVKSLRENDLKHINDKMNLVLVFLGVITACFMGVTAILGIAIL